MTTKNLAENVSQKIEDTKTEKHLSVIKELIGIINMQDQKMSELIKPLERSSIRIFENQDSLAQAVIETRIDLIKYETESRLKAIVNNI